VYTPGCNPMVRVRVSDIVFLLAVAN